MSDYVSQNYDDLVEIGPGICEEIVERFRSNTLVSDIDPLSIFPQDTPEDLEKLEARVEGWYNLITQLGELKSLPTFRADPFNRAGLLYLRIEQYMLLLTSPNCTPELKAQYWADVVAAQNQQNEETVRVNLVLTQSEFAVNAFEVVLKPSLGGPVAYTHTGPWEVCLKRATQFYRVRRWECSAWRVVFPVGDPLYFEQAEGLDKAIAQVLDDQENEAITQSLTH